MDELHCRDRKPDRRKTNQVFPLNSRPCPSDAAGASAGLLVGERHSELSAVVDS